ncbi:DUF3784 domain-containing protein [Limosilactobacillus gorillae]|uniref:DUF3784 domain-containing protein n=1 Tax=Limosilactobacillus gorillae TaxID=1450649 RepID=UPI000A9F1684|nr:DUF3784 domain-containing protein [Limosilactobacillus gorillae]
MKPKELHDGIKQNYETSKYDDNAKEINGYHRMSKNSYYLRALSVNIGILLVLLAIIYLPVAKSMFASYMWLALIFRIFIVLSIFGVIYALVVYLRIRKVTQPK